VTPPPALVVDVVDLGRRPGRPGCYRLRLRVEAGEMVAVVARHEPGASWLVAAVAGRCPTAGRVRIHARPARGAGGVHRCGGVVLAAQRGTVRWQAPVRVRDVVLAGRYPGNGVLWRPGWTDRVAAARVIDELGLGDLAHAPIGGLSGVQQQLVVLARALVRRPSLLALDEPFTGLDPAGIQTTCAAVRAAARRGTAVLCAMADLDLARDLFDRLVALHDPTGAVQVRGVPGKAADPDGIGTTG
jgi:manganese/iron transport system ATP-binding protein